MGGEQPVQLFGPLSIHLYQHPWHLHLVLRGLPTGTMGTTQACWRRLSNPNSDSYLKEEQLPLHIMLFYKCPPFKKDLFIFREREGREKERERNIDVREKHQLVVSHTQPDQRPNP